ncbi:MAG TPA: glycosyltransferase [Verrucomicrobia bacterium]|nr:glycosyltransferase [Verrucomicrobiota bacterium]HOB33920.1 glycosyltransferase family 2 protein [Verrucomicrobiota bacterium]HOP96848.1 glycosyltransferase family 2 protein [Verrucomicrobiota bacterium]
MTDELPLVSIIIPVHPAKAEAKAAAASRKLDYPREKLEIIVVRSTDLSTYPSMKRNAAIRAAKGEIIYFLDDDSEPEPQNLRLGIPRFADPGVKMVGGPNVCPPDAPHIEQVFAVVMGSWLAFGPSRARYRPVGRLRASGEKELISCNLLARRDALLEAGGFDESMYPNEENALMEAVRNRGGTLLYDPQMIVYRRPRSNLSSFFRMLSFYGKGRAEQFRLHPGPESIINFAPPLFCLYLLLVWFLPWWGWLPLAAYGLAVLVQTAEAALRSNLWRALCAMPLLALTNILYGCGFWYGLFTRIKPPRTGPAPDIRLETVTA